MADDFDMRMHRGTYDGFMTLLKWSVIFLVILMACLFAWVF